MYHCVPVCVSLCAECVHMNPRWLSISAEPAVMLFLLFVFLFTLYVSVCMLFLWVSSYDIMGASSSCGSSGSLLWRGLPLIHMFLGSLTGIAVSYSYLHVSQKAEPQVKLVVSHML